MMGTLRLVRNPPLICAVPLSFCSGICALTWMVTCEVVAVRGCQVPLQLPFCECFRTCGGSPLENVATAEPVSMGLPQSSITRTPTVLGQAAATAKLSASEVKIGASWEGVHPPCARRPGLAEETGEAGDAVTTKSRLTARVTPPENDSVNVPW